MKRSKIVELAKKAGGRFDGSAWCISCGIDEGQLEKFVELVVHHETKRLQKENAELLDALWQISVNSEDAAAGECAKKAYCKAIGAKQ